MQNIASKATQYQQDIYQQLTIRTSLNHQKYMHWKSEYLQYQIWNVTVKPLSGTKKNSMIGISDRTISNFGLWYNINIIIIKYCDIDIDSLKSNFLDTVYPISIFPTEQFTTVLKMHNFKSNQTSLS